MDLQDDKGGHEKGPRRLEHVKEKLRKQIRNWPVSAQTHDGLRKPGPRERKHRQVFCYKKNYKLPGAKKMPPSNKNSGIYSVVMK